MISVIVCSRKPSSWKQHEENIQATIGCQFEYIRIDNTNNGYSLCSAYNKGLEHARGDTCVFMHEDVFILQPGWGEILENKMKNDSTIGIVGVAGTQYLCADQPGWVAAGRPFIHGKVTHQHGNKCILSVYSWQEGDIEVVAVDGLFLAIRRSLFDTIKFDDQTFDKFHFYDLDICMQARKTHKIVVTDGIVLKHFSGGSFDSIWNFYAGKFINKYKNDLPATCTDIVPGISRERFESFDITEKIPLPARKIGM